MVQVKYPEWTEFINNPLAHYQIFPTSAWLIYIKFMFIFMVRNCMKSYSKAKSTLSLLLSYPILPFLLLLWETIDQKAGLGIGCLIEKCLCFPSSWVRFCYFWSIVLYTLFFSYFAYGWVMQWAWISCSAWPGGIPASREGIYANPRSIPRRKWCNGTAHGIFAKYYTNYLWLWNFLQIAFKHRELEAE